MSEAVPQGADRLPTLTEVVELGLDGRSGEPLVPAVPAQSPEPEPVFQPVPEAQAMEPPTALEADAPGPSVEPVEAVALPQASASLDAQALVTQVLAELNPRIDMLFQSRLREAMAPALARAADLLIREARDELSASVRELVQDAVTRALQRRLDQ